MTALRISFTNRSNALFLIAQCYSFVTATTQLMKAGTYSQEGNAKWQCANIPDELGELSDTYVEWIARNQKQSKQGVESTQEEGTFLAPLRNRKRRAIVFICLVIFILIGRSEIHKLPSKHSRSRCAFLIGAKQGEPLSCSCHTRQRGTSSGSSSGMSGSSH